MRWKTYGRLGVVLVYYVLTSVFTTIAERNFNERMNEDIGSFVSTYQLAQSDGDRAQALRTMLLETKHNTSSLVTGTTHAITASVMFMFILLVSWTQTGANGEKGRSAETDGKAKDEDAKRG